MVGVQEVDPFRADDGTTVQGHGLSLQLCDFAPRTCFTNVAQNTQSMTVVRITCTQLSSFLHDAETRDEIKRAQQGAQIGLPPNCRKRRRETAPPEALSPRKEAKFAKCEAEERARSEAQDTSWR
ncbi:hypothetical protein ABVK25_003530 [Lepraria finkii]|uniref:Uncharacterized protein n=1 Tax=Lepraria finkii TaxID=1340010 RepID=A0ABR4BDG5_9LECA